MKEKGILGISFHQKHQWELVLLPTYHQASLQLRFPPSTRGSHCASSHCSFSLGLTHVSPALRNLSCHPVPHSPDKNNYDLLLAPIAWSLVSAWSLSSSSSTFQTIPHASVSLWKTKYKSSPSQNGHESSFFTVEIKFIELLSSSSYIFLTQKYLNNSFYLPHQTKDFLTAGMGVCVWSKIFHHACWAQSGSKWYSYSARQR